MVKYGESQSQLQQTQEELKEAKELLREVVTPAIEFGTPTSIKSQIESFLKGNE